MALLRETLPNFYQELLNALEKLNRTEVVEQIPGLSVDRYTLDEEEHAMYLYTGRVRELNDIERNVIGVKHGECLELKEMPGMVVIDLDNFNRFMGIEILDRPDIENELNNKP